MIWINGSQRLKGHILLGSNESIPPPGSFSKQKVIARLSLRLPLNWNTLMIKKAEEGEERRTKRTLDKHKGKEEGRNKKRKRRKKKRQIKHEIDGIQNFIRNQIDSVQN